MVWMPMESCVDLVQWLDFEGRPVANYRCGATMESLSVFVRVAWKQRFLLLRFIKAMLVEAKH